MCGVCGIAPRDVARTPARERVRGMTATLRHRGPDSSGFHVAPGIALGVTRLAIVDLEHGDQPLTSEDGSVVVVANAEIYNAPELRDELAARGHRFRSRSDVEVVAHLYEDHGPDALQRLRGMFALALWDARRRRLLLARDRLGIKPLYYAETPEGLLFGSEQKALVAAGGLERRPNVHAVRDLFILGLVPAPDTLLRGVRQLVPGEYALWDAGGLVRRRYWDLDLTEDGLRSFPDWADAVRAKLEECVRLHLRSDVPVGAWLSRGVDSSAVVALMARAQGRPARTFSIAFDDAAADEFEGRSPAADAMPVDPVLVPCRREDYALLPRALWHSEEPSTFGFEIPRYVLARAAAREVKVVLTGEGADEIFGGYFWFRLFHRLRPFTYAPPALRRVAAWAARRRGRDRLASLLAGPPGIHLGRWGTLVGVAVEEAADGLLAPQLRAGPPPRAFEPPASWSDTARLQYYDTRVFMPNAVVPALDRATMAHGLEARVPFLDHQLVELVARVPAGLKRRGAMEKALLRAALRGLVPDAILFRRKRPFVPPVVLWASALPEFARELLSDRALADKGYFDPRAVARLRQAVRGGGRLEARALLTVVGVQLWDDLFLRARPEPPAS